jgi:hypothetical protein
MKRRHAVPVALAFFFALTASECEDLTTPDPEPTTLQVVSGDGQEGAVAQALPDSLVVRVLDQDDVPMEGVSVTWTTESGDVAGAGSTDASGNASAAWTLGTEAAAVTATAAAGGLEATFTATALPGPVTDLVAAPDTVTFAALADTATVTVTATDAYGNAVSAVSAAWHSRDTLVATVSAGLVTAVANGTTWVVGEADGAIDSVGVLVEQVATTVALTPDSVTMTVGDTLALSGTAEDANGHALASPSFSWSSSVTGVARVASTGVVTAVARGIARVSAAVDGAADTALVVVESDSGTVANPVCPEGNDAALEGHWSALEFWDGGDDDIAKGYSLLVSLAADSTGRIVHLVPEEVVPGDTVLATDSAHIDWVACGGQMAVTLVDQWLESSSGGFGSDEMEYTVTGDTLDLVIEAGSVYGTFVSVSTGVLDADLIGDWILIRDFYQSQSNPADTVDAVVEEGLLTQIMAGSDGTLVYAETDSLAERYEDMGVWSVRTDTIVYFSMRDGLLLIPYAKPAADRWTFTFDDESWDFDKDGTAEAATEVGTLARPDTAGLVDTWVATSYVVTNKADTTQSVDRIAEGASLEVTFDAQAGYTAEFADTSGTDLMTGTYEAAGGYLWMIETGEYLSFLEIAISGDTAAVTGTDWYDFDGDGQDEEAYMDLVLSRQP